MNIRKCVMYGAILGIMALSILAAIPVAASDSPVVDRAVNGSFVNPTAGATVSGTVAVDFLGDNSGAKLVKATVAVYLGSTAKVSFTTMTYTSANHWTYNWNTAA
jgi:hypothetical protein